MHVVGTETPTPQGAPDSTLAPTRSTDGTGVSNWTRVGVFTLILALFLAMFQENDSWAKRKGKGKRRVRSVRAKRGKAKRGKGKRRRSRRRSNRGNNNNNNGAVNVNNGLVDFGPATASLNPAALGQLQVVADPAAQGQFLGNVLFNPQQNQFFQAPVGAIDSRTGAFNQALLAQQGGLQSIPSFNGQPLAVFGLRETTREDIARMRNAGDPAASLGSSTASGSANSGVINLRRRD